MTISLRFYLDVNLSNPIVSLLEFEQATDGSTGGQVKVIYIGSTVPDRKFEAEMNSGVDAIILSAVDSQLGVGQEVSNVKLALDPGDLVNASAGGSLALPATILSGATNSIPVYIQVEDTNGEVSTDTSLSLTTTSIVETENTP
jgi:hypothetical protein